MFEIGDQVRSVLSARLKAFNLTAEQMNAIEPLKVPVWHVGGTDRHSCDILHLFMSNGSLKPFIGSCEFRCVAYSIHKLQMIMSSGIDVYPPTETFYASSPDKSNEYGGTPRILMMLDREKLENTYRILSKDATSAERDEVRRDYPFSAKRDDGTECFSRIKDESHRFSSYEFNYGKWIPGNSREALKGIVILDDYFPANPSEEQWKNRFVDLLTDKQNKKYDMLHVNDPLVGCGYPPFDLVY